ncbi:MAG: hypothetical protein DRP87_12160 [Spirochaetes bacterium]|nr:MAG: hypothetical protein DRP87_12160 [Spirochaetota bacterium]
MCGKRPGIKKAALLFLILCLFRLNVLTASDFSIHGSFKFFTLGILNPAFEQNLYGINTNVLKLDGALYPTSWLGFDIAYKIYSRIDSEALSLSSLSLARRSTGYRIGDIPERLFPCEDENLKNIGLYNDLDRAFITVSLTFADVYIGRQAISWGSARVINPTDILAPYSFNEIDTEEKRGVDAARIRIPVGAMNEIDLGYVTGEDFAYANSAIFARTKFYVLQTDVTMLVMDFRENLLGGLDITRSIGRAGSWVEASYVLPDVFSTEKNPDIDADYFGLSAGLDYSFSGKLYGYAEYHLNTSGKKDPVDYMDIIENHADYPAYNEGNLYLLGRHYLMIGTTYNLLPLLPVSALLMLNINDWSAMLCISGEYNIEENIYISSGFNIGIGEKPETATLPGSSLPIPTDFNSEFGAYPDLFYLGVKIYF